MSGKYRNYDFGKKTRRREIHPVWRGVGFLMMVLIPVVSWAAMRTVIDRNLVPIPRDLLARPGQIFYTLTGDAMIYIEVIIFLIFALVFYLVFTFISFLVTSAVLGSPAKYDPYYVPPVNRPTKRRK
jgi:hypothetical protein